MYWFRTGSAADALGFLILCLVWWSGGWLLVKHLFRLCPAERLLCGLATGLVLFLTLSNLCAHALPLPLAYWGAALAVLAGGALAALANKDSEGSSLVARFVPQKAELRAWPQLLVLLLLTVLFTLIGRGLAIFDDYLHLPLVSVMAAGDIPPHFYLDPSRPLAYHYGLQLLAAGMVRLGGLFPWSAWDISKAFAIALVLVLSWAWVRRMTGSAQAAFFGSLLVGFASGSRWLLLLLPTSALNWLSQGIDLINTGADSGPNLHAVLTQPWVIEGGAPVPFPFAMHNGVFNPTIFLLGASGAIPYVAVILLLLLGRKLYPNSGGSVGKIIVLSLAFAFLALSAEHLFVALWIGIAMSGLVYLVQNVRRRQPFPWALVLQWAAVLALAGILSVVQGAFLTVALDNVLLRLRGIHTVQGEFDYFSFVPQWPPVLVDGHLGRLSLVDLRQLLVLLAEAGPALLMAPLATGYAWRRIPRRDFIAAGIGLGALFSFFLPILFKYGVERSSTRLVMAALWCWVLLGFPALWQLYLRLKGRWLPRLVIRLGYGIAIFAGLGLFIVQLMAIPFPQFSYYILAPDVQMTSQYWNRLPPGAQVLDPVPYRAVVVFGRAARANQDFYNALPEWDALMKAPAPQAAAQAGYDFMYIEGRWWKQASLDVKEAWKTPCVKKYGEWKRSESEFRWLLDIRACK